MDNKDSVMREFSREILAFKDTCKIPEMAFAGMMIGAAATLAQRAGVPLEHMLTMAEKCFKDSVADDKPLGAANDV